jgi:hypothetical protein
LRIDGIYIWEKVSSKNFWYGKSPPPHWDSIPGPSNLQPVAILTMLPAPLVLLTGPPEILSKKILSKIEREMSDKK